MALGPMPRHFGKLMDGINRNSSSKKTNKKIAVYSNNFRRYKLFSKALENAYLTTFVGYIMCYCYIADMKFIDTVDLVIILLGFVFLLVIVAVNSYIILPEKEKNLSARHMSQKKKSFTVRVVTRIIDILLDKN